MKPVMIGGAILLLSIGVFTTTEVSGLTALVSGTDSSAKACVNAVNERDGVTLGVSDFEISALHLDSDGTKDIVLKNTTDAYCGSAGCVFEICLSDGSGVELLPFSYAGDSLSTLGTLTGGMYDIELEGKSTVRLVWDHTRYIHSK